MSAILLAEDSPTHTALMRSILEDDGHDVECVSNGCEAVQSLDRSLPDLVVTDLRMPEMNGMELVELIANQFPHLPTVVVTARGSESLAVDAALGAANFVPKNSLAKLLNRVVRQTIRFAELDHKFHSFHGELQSPEFSFLLSSDVSVIEPTMDFLVQSLAATGHLNPTHRIRITTAVACALLNAICFGILEVVDEETVVSRLLAGDETGIEDLKKRADSEPYRDRRVTMNVSVGRHDTRVSVSHTGRGRITRLTPAPGTPESFELEQCRGLMLMSSFMDEVFFRSGNSEVVMVKHHGEGRSVS